MNIVYIIDSLAQKGGAERIVSEKMSYLADHEGYDVTVITYYQYNTPNTYPLSNKVRQINLGFKNFHQYQYKYPKRIWIKWKYKKQLQKLLQEKINRILPDIIVGMSYTAADIVCNIKTDAAIVIEAHEARAFTMSSSFYGATSFWKKVYLRLHRRLYLLTIENKADAVVTLTHGDAKEWHKARKVEIIPNFSTMKVAQVSDGTSKRAIAVGRLDWQKGYDRMIEIWGIVTKQHPDWRLDIYGEGRLEKELKDFIQKKELNNIQIHPFTQDINQQYANSSLCLLTSHFEGFALVLLEAMKHGVPCITYDCPYGPSDVVNDNECGYVVENDNILQFAEKTCKLIENPELRAAFTKAAIKKSKTYDMSTIMEKWTTLFNSLQKKQA